MALQYTSRTGKTYYLHTGPKRGGGIQYFVSTKAGGTLADHLPEGFEIHESVHGQVFLRRKQPRLIRDEEIACVEEQMRRQSGKSLFKAEVQGETLTIFESSDCSDDLSSHFGFPARDRLKEELRERFASYQAVMRFTLVDPDRRLFLPERYCFRGSVDDWISIGPPQPMKQAAINYLKHLGRESLFELF
jgi:hypothetical protein